MPNVQVIPAKKPKLSAQVVTPTTWRRVAGYARVSTDKDEQLNSYEAQVDYYTNYIQSRPESGRSVRYRQGSVRGGFRTGD